MDPDCFIVGVVLVALLVAERFAVKGTEEAKRRKLEATEAKRRRLEAAEAERQEVITRVHQRGVAAARESKWEEALAAFFEAVELDPKRWDSWLALADWKAKTGQENEAHECLERAMAHAPVAELAKIKARLEMIRVRAQQPRANPQSPTS